MKTFLSCNNSAQQPKDYITHTECDTNDKTHSIQHTSFQKTNKQTPLNRGCLCRQQVQGASLALLFLKTYGTHHLLLFGNKVISCSLSKQPAVHASMYVGGCAYVDWLV